MRDAQHRSIDWMDVEAFEAAHGGVESALATIRTAEGQRFTAAVWRCDGRWLLNTQLTHEQLDPGAGVGEVVEKLLPVPLPWEPSE